MTPRAIKSAAVAGLALAIALLAYSLASGMQSSAITGPEALGATPRGEVWIGVDKALWRVSSQGRWLGATPVADLGLPGPPSNLVRQPDGPLVATVRDHPALFVLDPATAHVTRTIHAHVDSSHTMVLWLRTPAHRFTVHVVVANKFAPRDVDPAAYSDPRVLGALIDYRFFKTLPSSAKRHTTR